MVGKCCEGGREKEQGQATEEEHPRHPAPDGFGGVPHSGQREGWHVWILWNQ